MATLRQFVLTVNDAKGFAKYVLYDLPDSISTDALAILAGGPSIDVQLEDPDGVHLFDVSVSSL